MKPQSILASGVIALVCLSATPSSSASTAVACDASLWKHVYNPSRLQVVNSCVTATGIIEESDVNDDGDHHFLLKLDAGQDALLKKKNWKKKTGNLVLEIVCAHSTTMKKPRKACAGYTNPISIPAMGTHVRVTGSYVIDSHNGWAEIHPVSQIEAM